MNSSLTIRKLGPENLDEYIRLRREGVRLDPIGFGKAYTTEEHIPRSVYAQFLAPSPLRSIWGAFCGGSLVGMVRLQAEGDETRNTIYSLYVCPKMRQRGIGRRLLLQVIHEAVRNPKVAGIYLNVITKSDGALALYRSAGFLECGVQEDTFSVGGKFYSEFRMYKRLLRPQMANRNESIKAASALCMAAPFGGQDFERPSEAA